MNLVCLLIAAIVSHAFADDKVFSQSFASRLHPCEGALDDPTFCDDNEAICIIGPTHDLKSGAWFHVEQGAREFVSCIPPISEEVGHRRPAFTC